MVVMSLQLMTENMFYKNTKLILSPRKQGNLQLRSHYFNR